MKGKTRKCGWELNALNVLDVLWFMKGKGKKRIKWKRDIWNQFARWLWVDQLFTLPSHLLSPNQHHAWMFRIKASQQFEPKSAKNHHLLIHSIGYLWLSHHFLHNLPQSLWSNNDGLIPHHLVSQVVGDLIKITQSHLGLVPPPKKKNSCKLRHVYDRV